MQLFTGILTNTPIWVWALFAFLMYRGWAMSRDRAVSPISLLLVPGIFLSADVAQLALAPADMKMLPLTAMGAVLGLSVVLLLKPARSTIRLPDGKLQVEGEWISITLFLFVFLGNYVNAILAVINPPAAEPVRLVASVLNGFSISFMLARSIAHLLTGRLAQADNTVSC